MAMDMFMKIDEVDGESKDGKHRRTSTSWRGAGAPAQSGTRTGSGGGAGKVNVQDLSFTKYVDKSSHALLLACCKGTHYAKAVLVVRKAGDKPLEYFKITMENLIVSSSAPAAAAARTG